MDERQLAGVRTHLSNLGREWQPSDVAEALREQHLMVSDALLLGTIDELRRSSVGAGPLEPLLRMPGVTDVLVNGPEQVFVDRGNGLERARVSFTDDAEVRRLASRLAASAGRRLDDASPCVDARLADGTRLHAVLAPIAEPGTCLSLRVPAHGGIPLSAWISSGSMSHEMGELLRGLIDAKAAFLISGGTGTGKTTLLASLLSVVPRDQRIVIVEDSRELLPDHPHCVRLEARHPNAEGAGAVTLTDLVRQALRMRPDRLVVGEVRGAELSDLLMALNTGHEGGCGTVHANSCADVPARLEALAALSGMPRDACHAQIGAALHAVVHLHRDKDGRRTVEQVALLRRRDDGLIEVLPAATARGDGIEPGPGYAAVCGLAGLP